MNFTGKIYSHFPLCGAGLVILRSRMILFFALVWLAGANLVSAQDIALSEYQVKAAFLYNFGKFVEWPTNAFATTDAPLVIGIVGEDPFHGDLERIVANKKIAGHTVVVRAVSTAADMHGCHIIFVCAAAEKSSAVILNGSPQPGMLTVTENDAHFAASVFIINFVQEDSKIRFEINTAMAARAGLKISSKLLTLAKPMEK